MAVGAFLKWQGLLEICFGVALHAVHLGVLSKKGKVRLGMGKRAVQPRNRSLVPSHCAVAGLTGLREASAVGIRMAIGAVGKCYADVAWLLVCPQSVAALAGDLCVQARKRITCRRMIELTDADRLPVNGVVTLQAIGPKPAVVLVLMTGGTTRGNSKECPGQILDVDFRAFTLGYTFRRVTPVAFQPCVFPFESPAGLLVIESLEVPFCQREVFAVVLGVTGDAFRARSRLEVVSGVQPLSRPDAPCNFGVAIQAFEGGLSGREFVAGGAVRHAIDRLVRARERARRNLGGSRNQCPQNSQNDPPQKSWLRESAISLHEAHA